MHTKKVVSTSMGERTVLTLNTKNRASLRTSVPMFIVKQWNLQAGEHVEWSLEVCKEGELVATIRKATSVPNTGNKGSKK